MTRPGHSEPSDTPHTAPGQRPKVVLAGLPGAGKSTMWRRIGHALHLPVIDTDELIAERFNKPCGDVLRELGEEKFRAAEEEAVAQALKTNAVVSLGGGAVKSVKTREALMNHQVVYLYVDVAEGVRRTSGNKTRPLLDVPNPEEVYQRLYDERHELYEEVASFRIRSGNHDPQRTVSAILQYLEDAEQF